MSNAAPTSAINFLPCFAPNRICHLGHTPCLVYVIDVILVITSGNIFEDSITPDILHITELFLKTKEKKI